MSTVTDTAYAKINLALHVRERMPDGYHRIETLFAFCDDGDRLSAAAADELTLHVLGPFAAGLGDTRDNLVLRAARALAAEAGVSAGAAIRLDKRLPVASGIGGGSADAAATLRMLVRLWRFPAEPAALHRIAAALGADVPACLASTSARGDGRGDDLRAAQGASGSPVLLVNPGVAVSTAAVFGAWDGVDRGAMPDDWSAARNDLEAPALRLAPEIKSVLAVLRDQRGATAVRMSGSGATCFALFDDAVARDAAAQVVVDHAPGWWRMAAILR